jgi:hypothetical protein
MLDRVFHLYKRVALLVERHNLDLIFMTACSIAKEQSAAQNDAVINEK